MEIYQRLALLRKAMDNAQIDAYLIPTSDPHQSEYVADYWKAREWISGFTGSAGIVVVTQTEALVWTDSRYYIQAEEELKGTPFTMHPLIKNGKTQYPHWLAANLKENDTIGIDGFLWTQAQVNLIKQALQETDISLKTDVDLVADVWEARPVLPKEQVFELNQQYAGVSRVAKLTKIRSLLQQRGAQHYLVTKLDDIAWILNLRGRDVSFNPVFIAYLWISGDHCILFINESKVPAALRQELSSEKIEIKPYRDISSFLNNLPSEHGIIYTETSLNLALRKKINPERSFIGPDLIEAEKAIKNSTEVDLVREVMVKDGVALVKFYRWLEELIPSGYITEYDAARQLAHFRSQQDLYFGESFSAIVGYRSNGAIVHYRPDQTKSSVIGQEGMLLIDSGGQYLDGTTDITRTIRLGEPTAEEKSAFTQVLKGHIALATIHFPQGTTGGQLDVLARMHLWKTGRNYGHGTGHGVGFFLNVHEGPQNISPLAATQRGRTALQPGMITSNEPGFYKTGDFGIRTENLILCVDSEFSTDDEAFYKFETLTLFPIDVKLIDLLELSPEEIGWLNGYHNEVFDRLHPYLNEAEKDWLDHKCAPISRPL